MSAAVPSTLGTTPDVTRRDVTRFLDGRKIDTRVMSAVSILDQSAYGASGVRVVGVLRNSDIVRERSFWLGVYPALTHKMLDFVVNSLSHFVADLVAAPREIGAA